MASRQSGGGQTVAVSYEIDFRKETRTFRAAIHIRIQWRIKNVRQPRSVFRHLVCTIWAEDDCQGQTPRYSYKDAQRWDRWIRFCAETHAVSTPAEMPALTDFFSRHRTVYVALFLSNRYWGIVTVPGSFLKACNTSRVHIDFKGNGAQAQRTGTQVFLYLGTFARVNDSRPRRLTRSPRPCLERANFYPTGPIREQILWSSNWHTGHTRRRVYRFR